MNIKLILSIIVVCSLLCPVRAMCEQDKLLFAMNSAIVNNNWPEVVRLSRIRMHVFSSTMTDKDKASTLNSLALGLNKTKKYNDAIPVAKRCIEFDKNSAGCFRELGEAYYETGELDAAKEALQGAINVGAVDMVSASAIESAKSLLRIIELHLEGRRMANYYLEKMYNSELRMMQMTY